MVTIKNNYYLKSLEIIEEIKKLDYKPTIGMHTCCGPCATWPLEFLIPYFHVVLIYNNSNIYPEAEYKRRKEELIRYVEIFNNEHNSDVKVIEFPYLNKEYTKKLEPLKNDKEGGGRCHLCYTLRMEQAYTFADEHNYDYFVTVMSISTQKDSQVLNRIGEILSHKHKAKYFYSDFKKNNGMHKGLALRKKYNLYAQNYCGCIYSYEEMLNRTKNKNY